MGPKAVTSSGNKRRPEAGPSSISPAPARPFKRLRADEPERVPRLRVPPPSPSPSPAPAPPLPTSSSTRRGIASKRRAPPSSDEDSDDSSSEDVSMSVLDALTRRKEAKAQAAAAAKAKEKPGKDKGKGRERAQELPANARKSRSSRTSEPHRQSQPQKSPNKRVKRHRTTVKLGTFEISSGEEETQGGTSLSQGTRRLSNNSSVIDLCSDEEQSIPAQSSPDKQPLVRTAMEGKTIVILTSEDERDTPTSGVLPTPTSNAKRRSLKANMKGKGKQQQRSPTASPLLDKTKSCTKKIGRPRSPLSPSPLPIPFSPAAPAQSPSPPPPSRRSRGAFAAVLTPNGPLTQTAGTSTEANNTAASLDADANADNNDEIDLDDDASTEPTYRPGELQIIYNRALATVIAKQVPFYPGPQRPIGTITHCTNPEEVQPRLTALFWARSVWGGVEELLKPKQREDAMVEELGESVAGPSRAAQSRSVTARSVTPNVDAAVDLGIEIDPPCPRGDVQNGVAEAEGPIPQGGIESTTPSPSSLPPSQEQPAHEPGKQPRDPEFPAPSVVDQPGVPEPICSTPSLVQDGLPSPTPTTGNLPSTRLPRIDLARQSPKKSSKTSKLLRQLIGGRKVAKKVTTLGCIEGEASTPEAADGEVMTPLTSIEVAPSSVDTPPPFSAKSESSEHDADEVVCLLHAPETGPRCGDSEEPSTPTRHTTATEECPPRVHDHLTTSSSSGSSGSGSGSDTQEDSSGPVTPTHHGLPMDVALSDALPSLDVLDKPVLRGIPALGLAPSAAPNDDDDDLESLCGLELAYPEA